MEDMGSDFDLESYIENINPSQSGSGRELRIKNLQKSWMILPCAPMTNLHNTEASQKAYTKQYISTEAPRDKKLQCGNPIDT